MEIAVHFYSYFKDLAGCDRTRVELEPGATLGTLADRLGERFPRLAKMRKSTLMAVGVEYQGQDYVLKDGDAVSLFPPVQGG